MVTETETEMEMGAEAVYITANPRFAGFGIWLDDVSCV